MAATSASSIRIKAAPAVYPAPPATSSTLLPAGARPLAIASSSAMAQAAPEVFPTVSTLTNIFSGGMPASRASRSSRRLLGWWGTTRSTSESFIPSAASRPSAVAVIPSTAWK